MLLADDILQVRAPLVNFHVLRDGDALYLIDGGFVGGRWLLRRALRRHGWDNLKIAGILLTHGHLDHTFNLGVLQRETGAWVAAPAADSEHIQGIYPYRGMARICGWLEAAARFVFRYEKPVIDRVFSDGETFAIWEGIIAVGLPGHTSGHTGYYCAARKLLFCGDLFACYTGTPHWAPAIFNSHPELMKASLQRALALDLEQVFPNHTDRASGYKNLQRMRELR